MGTNKSKAKQEMSEQGPDPTDMGAPNMQFMIKKLLTNELWSNECMGFKSGRN